MNLSLQEYQNYLDEKEEQERRELYGVGFYEEED